MKAGIFVIDKPRDFTSHDVIAKMRNILHERRIGHSGTLDPLATGVLPVFVGRPATRAVEFAMDSDKEYVACVKLGIKTDTMDITGNILKTSPVDITDRQLERTLNKFRGEISQTPPMYSAVKIGGQKLYNLARKGIEVPREPRSVTIYELERLPEVSGPDEFFIRVLCSKGTYIRVLCDDLGEILGCGATLKTLRRTKCGVFSLKDAVTIDDVKNLAETGDPFSLARGVDFLFSEYPCITVSDESVRLLKNGVPFPVPGAAPGTYRVYSRQGEFMMLGNAVKSRLDGMIMTAIKSFCEG